MAEKSEKFDKAKKSAQDAYQEEMGKLAEQHNKRLGNAAKIKDRITRDIAVSAIRNELKKDSYKIRTKHGR